MYVERIRKKQGEKVYEQILLRESYRVRKDKVDKRTLLNLTHFPREQVEAIEWALRNPHAVALGVRGEGVTLREGKSVGAVWAVAEAARRLGVVKALGGGRQGSLALWQIVARVLDQGSRLSAVRLHETHALADVLELERGFDEDDLYENLAWLSEHQEAIDHRLFKTRRNGIPPTLFLYDVTSSHLEGDCNALGAYGYNRDGKKGKKQIVVGLLCDESGEPVSVEVFSGNTQDPKTVGSQAHKVAERFGCQKVTFVGDRGMIKQAQKNELTEAGFYYITALTRPRIEKLLKGGALQMELFDAQVCEVALEGRRLVLRRNPIRAQELAATREDKRAAVASLVAEQNAYLDGHPRAKTQTALTRVRAKINRLRVNGWLHVVHEGRTLRLVLDEAAREAESRLDG
ncbi:MAG: IS1634 family transposase, partial [Chloroflexi bacterium]|nr:IS1634 family transposase [Chloroflexota bacterium]